MLIATFKQTTGWAGKTITWDEGVFTLEGHGAIAVGDVVHYDLGGQLDNARWDAGRGRIADTGHGDHGGAGRRCGQRVRHEARHAGNHLDFSAKLIAADKSG